MKTNFNESLIHILRSEGGYVDHPLDPGGATNYGITHRTLASWRGVKSVTRKDVKNISTEEVVAIYKARYWDAVKADELPSGIDLAVFDAAVNKGPRRAVQLLQRAADASPDGVIGPKTLAAINKAHPIKLLNEYMALRMMYYGTRGHFKSFALGWSRRTMDVHMYALSMIVNTRAA